MAACADIAKAFVSFVQRGGPIDPCYFYTWARSFEECSDFPQPKKKKQVWQWRYRGPADKFWGINLDLYDEEAANKIFTGYFPSFEKHAGPFEVDE